MIFHYFYPFLEVFQKPKIKYTYFLKSNGSYFNYYMGTLDSGINSKFIMGS